MKQYEAVIEALRQNSGYATLGQLYHLVDYSNWGTRTPHASIRRIVQQRPEIYKVKPGLWALKEFEDQLPAHLNPAEDTPQAEIAEYDHYYYQGLLLEIGALRGFETYVPAQDKNRLHLKTKLGDIADITTCPPFSYDSIVSRAATVDVLWFNERGLPIAAFEVEHTGDFQNSLLKFIDLQDFYVEFRVVADEGRKRLFEQKMSFAAFKPFEKRFQFMSYDSVAKRHEHEYQLSLLEP